MASRESSSTKNPLRKMPITYVIDISSNETSPIPQNNISTTLDTTLALTIPSSITSQATPTQGIDVSPLAPRALIFLTPPSSPFEPHPYLTSLEDLPPRSSNPPPTPSSQGFSQTLPQQTPMDFEPSFPPINLSKSRMSAQPVSRNQVLEELGQLCTLSPITLKKQSKLHKMCKIALSLPPPSLPCKCHHHFTSPPPLLHPFHHIDPHFHHQIHLSLSITPYGSKDPHHFPHLKNTLIPNVNAPKHSSITVKMK
ncbi:hypothetical protein Tco_0659985 [Tanacetum coccineum]